MSELKHTPGPWVATLGKYSLAWSVETVGENGDTVAALYQVDREGDSYAFDDDRDEANARLIAAAPDLLEALESASNLIHRLMPNGHIDNRLTGADEVKAAIRKAIDKAGG